MEEGSNPERGRGAYTPGLRGTVGVSESGRKGGGGMTRRGVQSLTYSMSLCGPWCSNRWP